MQWLGERGRQVGARTAQWLAWWYVCLGTVWLARLDLARVWVSPSRQQRAQAFIEYAVLAGLLGVAVIVALTVFGPQLAGVFDRFGRRLVGMG